jgi:hypothetical protein
MMVKSPYSHASVARNSVHLGGKPIGSKVGMRRRQNPLAILARIGSRCSTAGAFFPTDKFPF